ncbi:MAG: ribonuclease P protein component [Patescibacteria group bacterium]|nr:ribonuclease P protein component [Patescibacteria group bacterium]
MLPKEKRLRDTKDFKRVYVRGSFFSGKYLTINYLINKTHLTRVGVVAGKKVSAKAVERNKVKRRAREAVHALYEKLPAGYDIIVNIKKEAKSASVADLGKDLAGLIGKVDKR